MELRLLRSFVMVAEEGHVDFIIAGRILLLFWFLDLRIPRFGFILRSLFLLGFTFRLLTFLFTFLQGRVDLQFFLNAALQLSRGHLQQLNELNLLRRELLL